MNVLYQGERASILLDTLVLSGKDGQSDMILSPPTGVSFQTRGVRKNFETLTADRLVIKSDSGTTFFGTGAGTITINLPEAGTDEGIAIRSIADASTIVRLNPVGTENIVYSGGSMALGEYLELAADAKLKLVSSGTGLWVATLESGTLTEETP